MTDLKKIVLEKNVNEKRKEELGVSNWPVWSCEPSTFDWSYDADETCYIIEGEANVKGGGQEVSFGPGDIVTFPKGLECVWTVHKKIRKRRTLSKSHRFKLR